MTEEMISLAPYDPAWPRLFAEERTRLEVVLRPWLAGPIEHIGSTAVPGLTAKPVIDIMAGVRDLESSLEAGRALARLDYVYFPYRPDVMHWFCKPSPERRTHHLHLVPIGSALWSDRLLFRDYLRSTPAAASEYAALKGVLAARYHRDREAYTEAKSDFVGSILARTTRSALLAVMLCSGLPSVGVGQSGQNPSPMVETTRVHERLAPDQLEGVVRAVRGPGDRPFDLFIPKGTTASQPITLVVHFHGAAWLPHQAVAGLRHNAVSAVVNLGAGSSAYDRAFSNPASFAALLRSITDEIALAAGAETTVTDIVLTAFSAGHGAVRTILRDTTHFNSISSILLLDGMHTSYVPDAKVIAAGGSLNHGNLDAFADFARAAMSGSKRFLVTHSEIFPGTFASTTETADWLLAELGLRRSGVLRWGPRGMQQLSEVRAGGFELLGYAGNSAPDHVDHFHALPELLARLLP